MTVSPRDRLSVLLAPELLDAIEDLIAERVAAALASAGPMAAAVEWLTVDRAAELLGCSPDAVRMRAHRGRLDFRHQGRRMYVSARSVATLTASRPVPVVQGRR